MDGAGRRVIPLYFLVPKARSDNPGAEYYFCPNSAQLARLILLLQISQVRAYAVPPQNWIRVRFFSLLAAMFQKRNISCVITTPAACAGGRLCSCSLGEPKQQQLFLKRTSNSGQTREDQNRQPALVVFSRISASTNCSVIIKMNGKKMDMRRLLPGRTIWSGQPYTRAEVV
jgi:hypothetical protein